MSEIESLERTLSRARRVLQILEEERAGYTVLSCPPDLIIQLEDQQKKVNSLEVRLVQMKGRERATSVPDNLPTRPPIFVGRAAEMGRCLSALDPEERGWGVTVDGIGGIGKTALALEVAHHARKAAMFDAYLFTSAKTAALTPDGMRSETLARTSLDAFVREFALGLGNRSVAEIPDGVERRRALLEALRGRRALLVWDNLETLTKEERDAVTEFLRHLPTPNKAIITSRRRTGESALTVRLDKLGPEAAFALMERLGQRHPRLDAELQRASSPRLCQNLYDLAGGNPLAIYWTLGLVAQKGYSLRDALARLQDAARSRDLYGFLFARAAEDLLESDRKALSALAFFQTPATAAALCDAAGLVWTEVEMALERLVTLSLVNDLAGGQYGLHPLTRTYVRAALGTCVTATPISVGDVELAPEVCHSALRYWVDYAERYGQQNYRTFDHLEMEWPSLEEAARALYEMVDSPSGEKSAARLLNDLADTLHTFLHFRGYWDERLQISSWAYEAMARWEHWRDAGWRAYQAAYIHYYRAETEEAAIWAERAAEAWERDGERRDQATGTHLRGLIARQRGELDEAEECLAEALNAYRELERTDDVSIVLNDLGNVARQRRAYDCAEEHYREALEIAERQKNREHQANYSINLGRLALDRGEPEEGRPWFKRGLALAHDVGRADMIADGQWGLARIFEEEGRFAAGLPLAEAALATQERLRDRNLKITQDLVSRLRRRLRQ